MSPGDLGQSLKPFVFLDAFDIEPKGGPMFGWHPHSGIATLTVVIDGQIGFAETTGVKGVLDAGGIEWMRAGNGVWHSGSVEGEVRAKGFQLWVALPPGLENGVPESRYLSADDVPAEGPVRVILGSYGKVSARVSAPPGINYLDVRLKAGERWRYQPPASHDVAWIAVQQGTLLAPDTIDAGELIVFVEGDNAIELEAVDATRFVLGSAVKHPHDLVLGNYSVHTSAEALAEGEAEIERIGSRFFTS
ncbi:MAG TPA: pirin family protein [Luteibacter sp.]|jgi:redox-sensitive bicupin YhaK (pirin superfamily)|nr:pirin family protein [Luteibacter sp.]